MGGDRIKAEKKSSYTLTPGSKPKQSSFLQPRYQDAFETETISPTAEKQLSNSGQSTPTAPPSDLSPVTHSFGEVSVLPVQAKLTIGQPNDKYEQEADRVASQVVQQINVPSSPQPTPGQSLQRMDEPEEEEIQTKPMISVLQRMPEEEEELQAKRIISPKVRSLISPVIQRMDIPEEEEELQAKRIISPKVRSLISPVVQRMDMPDEEDLQAKSILQRQEAVADGEASTDLDSAINSSRGGGQPLDTDLQESMGQAMRADLSGVRIHADAQSDQLNQSIQARAFTTGQDVFFRQGEYQPGSRGGQELIAHELTHVVQQTGTGNRKQNNSVSTKSTSEGLKRQGVSWGSTKSDHSRSFSDNQSASLWGTSQQTAQPNLFAQRAIKFVGSSSSNTAPDIQCYKTSAGFFSNKVKFESTALNAAIAGALNITKTGTDVTIDSPTYVANGTVKASGAKPARVNQYQVGFLQTVYSSNATAYYEPAPYNPSLGRRIGSAILPSLLGDRRKSTWRARTPVRDGDAGVMPWYEINDVADFGKAKVSTKNTQMDDTPGFPFQWTENFNGKTQNLVKIRGQHAFRSWLSVQRKGTTGFFGMHRLGYIDWKVDYGTDITYNKAMPAASVVTPTGNSGGKIIGTHEGPGFWLPKMGDPVSNDLFKMTKSKW